MTLLIVAERMNLMMWNVAFSFTFQARKRQDKCYLSNPPNVVCEVTLFS